MTMTRDIAIKCPVCLGKCKDEHGAECKPCGGKGILWGKETDDTMAAPVFVPMPYPQPYPQPFVPPILPWWQQPGNTWTTPVITSDSIA